MQKVFIITLLASAVSVAQPVSNVAQPVTTTAPPASNLVTSKHTPTAEAPAFGTGNWFRKVILSPKPKVELRAPVRLEEFVVDSHLELSLRNYVDLVLTNNTDVAIERLTIETPRNQILRAYGVFDPTIVTSFQATRAQSPAQDQLAGADVNSTLRQPFSLSAQQVLPTGTLYRVGFDASKFSTNSIFQTFNPSISSGLNLRFEQPLVRNRGAYLTRLPITIARSRVRQSGYSVENNILRLVAQAENAYWDVIFARENLKVQEQNLGLNEKLRERARRELELGVISELEIYQPEGQYKNAEIALTQARFRLQAAEDALRRQISVDLDPKLRNLPIVLTEDVTPPLQTAFDRETLVEKAVRQRPDLLASRQQLDVDDLQVQVATNALKPDLRLTGNYSASGLGGTYRPRAGSVLPGTELPVAPGTMIPGGIGDSLSQVFNFNYPTYAFGLQLSLPLRDRRGSADYADAVVNKRLNMLRLRNAEQATRLEVLNAITQVEQSKASVDLATVALDLAQKRLDGDQKRYDLGTITLFFLLDAQNAYNISQSNLVNQMVQYRRNLTNLSRVTGDLLSERGIAVQ
jgi:outer membrane protein TolC